MAIEYSILPNDRIELLEVPIGKSYAITTVLVCNHDDTTSGSFDMNLVKSGDAVGDKNMVVNRLELPPGETFTFDTEKIVLEEGDFVSFFATDTNLSALVSYLEV